MLSTDRCGLIALGETNGRLRLGLAALVVDRLAPARSAHREGLEHPEEPLCRHGSKAGDNSWVAGVELAIASEPPARRPRIWGRRPPGVDPSHPEL